MLITVTTGDGQVCSLDVSEDLQIMNLKALLEMETGIAKDQMTLIFNMAHLTNDHATLEECNIQEGDILVVMKVDGSGADQIPPPTAQSAAASATVPTIDWSNVRIPTSVGGSVQTPQQQQASASEGVPGSNNSIEEFIQYFLTNPDEFAMLQQRSPQIAQALLTGNVERIREAYMLHREQLMEIERERQVLAGLDPWSEEYQQKLAEIIRQRNVRENLETAIEHNPEIFAGRVVMLYVQCKVNGVPVKALVDTGAQMTIMNVGCAERCNVMRLVDRRYAGYAFGVGRQRIIGVIHLGQIQLGDDFLASSFRVLEDQSHEIILGLDMLKRHQCIIDLSKVVLRVGTTGNETPFLTETEVPQSTVVATEDQGIMHDEDREMASIIAKSEQEYKDTTGELPPSPPSFPESAIQSIVSAGFSRNEAISELQKFNGDVTKAMASLFAKSLSGMFQRQS